MQMDQEKKPSSKEPPAEHIAGQAQQLGYPTHFQSIRSRSRLVLVECFFTTQYNQPLTFLCSGAEFPKK
jgi:hypothetical protein